jgi:predicted nucleotidyltransferase
MKAQRSGESALLLLDVIQVLNAAGVPYAVIGAMAAAVHGAVRASLDADAIIGLPAHRVAELVPVARSAGLQVEVRHGDPDDPIAAVVAVTDQFDNRVDLLAGLKGIDPAAFRRTVDIPFQGATLKVVGREDLVAMKAFAGSPQDLADAAAVLAANVGELDYDLLARLAARFGAEAEAALAGLLQPPV